MELTKVSVVLSMLAWTLLTTTSGQCISSTPFPCTFKLLYNKTFVDNIVQYLDQDSYTVILEYILNLTNVGPDFDLVKRTSPDAFQPWRWFRTQGKASSQLLLIYHYYYGLLKPMMAVSISELRVDLVVSPKDCFSNVTREDAEVMIRNYLLQDFNIDSKTAKHSFKYSDDVEICTARIGSNAGWGKLIYRCCGCDSDDSLYCHDVSEDGWVWALKVFIVVLTVFFCLYMPVLIPKAYIVSTYSYDPKDDLKFQIVITKNAERYCNLESAALIQSSCLKHMKAFLEEVKKLEIDHMTTVSVKKLELSISEEKIFVENGQTVKTLRALFNGLIRCKIQRSEPVKECCNTPACGTHCCTKCPRWSSWLRALRTILVLSILALPSVPFMYAMCVNGLDYQVLSQAFREKGLKSTFDFYTGPIVGKVIVGFVSVMYVLHGLIIVIDGASNRSINKLYTEVLNEDGKKERVRRRMQLMQRIIKKGCLPVKRFGAIFVPCWILMVLLSPLPVLLTFLISSPMVQVIIQLVKRILLRARMLKDNPKSAMRMYNRCEMFLFFFTAIFMVVVLTFGANFLVHVLVMTIVMIVVEAELMYRVLPVVFIMVIYIRDSYSTIGKKFDAFLGTIFNYVSNKQIDEMRREAFKPSDEQENKIFNIPADIDVQSNPSDENTADETTVTVSPSKKRHPKLTPLFDLKDGALRFKMKQFLVFLDNNDNLYISKKFLFHCSTVDCTGAPGTLGENYINATMEFFKIGVFILFIFLVIMAYGSIYYISPTNHLFITLITGLIPLIIKNIFSGGNTIPTVNTSNFRFQAQFKEKVETFNQCWTVEDIHLKPREYNNDDIDHVLRLEQFPENKSDVDLLVVSINDEFNQSLSVGQRPKSHDSSRGQGDSLRSHGDERALLEVTSNTVSNREIAFTDRPSMKVKTILADISVPKSKSTDVHQTNV
ncbi:CAunnamed protein product [Biomphalaria glabrata]|nr:CAunnamed protein product [Biomphalaria glabrata]